MSKRISYHYVTDQPFVLVSNCTELKNIDPDENHRIQTKIPLYSEKDNGFNLAVKVNDTIEIQVGFSFVLHQLAINAMLNDMIIIFLSVPSPEKIEHFSDIVNAISENGGIAFKLAKETKAKIKEIKEICNP